MTRRRSSPSDCWPAPTRSSGAWRRSQRRATGIPSSSRSSPRGSPSRRNDGSAQLPTSIRAIVAARLDALPAPERAILLDAAVVGRVFWRGALAQITPRSDLSACLGSLEARDFIRREAVSRIQGDQQFAFKHGLIRDVAYQTLPRAARRERHAIVAGFLEEAISEVGQSDEALAQHWREAGDHDLAVKHFIAARRPGGPRLGEGTGRLALPRGAGARPGRRRTAP